MPELDLSAATGLRVAGKDAAEVRIAGRTVWAAPRDDRPVFALTFVTTTADQVAAIALGGCGDGNTMDWGDGTTETLDTGAATGNAPLRTHTYAAPGTYQAVYRGTFTNIGSSSQTAAQTAALVSIDQWSPDTGTVNGSYAFYQAANLTTVATPPPSLTSMSYMFSGATVFSGDVSGWDTSKVTTMRDMFNGAAAFNGDLSAWDTSAVTTMQYMFTNATVFSGDVSGWDTSKVTTMSYMFFGATVFDQDLSAWDTSKVTNMVNMFRSAAAFDQDLSGWVVTQNPAHTGFNTGANPDWVANGAWQPQWPA